ncbi:MAG: radical SAM protein [Phycisphaerales bacterium]|nr:radical SAM protein [Phycisphaerales bacterium]
MSDTPLPSRLEESAELGADAYGFDPGWIAALIHGEVRLDRDMAMRILETVPLFTLGRWADARCRVLHGNSVRTYVIDRNINYTNVCTAHCTFCAFRRDGDEDDAYTLSREQISAKIAELEAIGGTQILMQGGMNPELPLSWYEDLLSGIKADFPHIHIHAFSPPEFIEFVRFFDPPGDDLEAKLLYVFERLRKAGLDSLPGGGGEIFALPVRRKIGLGKCTAQEWLTVMRVAHRMGMYTSATMMFGHIEGRADRIDHMDLVRTWQDRSINDFARSGGGRYKAFISWPFQRENTPLGRLPEWDAADGAEFPGDAVAAGRNSDRFGKVVRMAGASEYLRTQAISRLYLDNVYSIGASWVTMGPHIGQVALHFGASDMGSVMMEENVVSAAGTTYCLTEALICRLIRNAGFLPAQRDNVYNLLRVHDGDDAPDLLVADWSQQRARKLAIERKQAVSAPVEVTVSAASEEVVAD